MRKFLLIPLIVLLSGINVQAQSCDSVTNLPDTVKMCAFTPYTFHIDTAGPLHVLSMAWWPSAGFNDTTLLNPTLTSPGVPTMYYVAVNALLGNNLVVNPHFSAGNTGFYSAYNYVADGAGSLGTPGDYTTTLNPLIGGGSIFAVNLTDHTNDPPTNLMFAVNALQNFPTVAWQETVTVTANTNYAFSAWFANFTNLDTSASGAPKLQFVVNGVTIAPEITFNDVPGYWHQYHGVWNSGATTTAVLTIMSMNTAGLGDAFAIDDIDFDEYCTSIDSVYFAVSRPDTTTVRHDTSVCSTIPSILLTVQDGYSYYNWNVGGTKDTTIVSSNGTYILYSYQSCAARIDSFYANFIPVPVNNIPLLDTFCQYDSLIIKPTVVAGTTFTWGTGSMADSIVIKNSSTVTLLLNNQGCTSLDTFVFTMHQTPKVFLGPDTASCLGVPIVLQSSYTYPSTATYLWTTGWTAFDTTVSSSGTYWLQVTDSGCVGSDTIKVQIVFDTLDFKTPDTVAICKGNAYQTLVAGDASITYSWIPTTGIAAANLPNPVINTDTSAWYVLTCTDGYCPVKVDSFYLEVQPTPQVYIDGYRNVCQYDSIHINVSVNPPYPYYTFSWAPTTNLDNDTSGTVVFTSNFNKTDTTTLYVWVTTSGGCSGEDSSYIYSHPGNFLYINPNVIVCPGTSVQLIDSGAVGYHWSPGLYLSDSTSPTPVITPLTNQNYTLTAVSQYGCWDSLTMNVQVYPNAILKLPDTVLLYPGQNYQMDPLTNCVDFTWYPPDGLTSAIVSNPIASPTQNTQYIVVGVTENNCEAVDTINLVMNPTTILAVPNAFTPGASVNNVLYIKKEGLASLNYFRIFDRWGVKVFETNNIDQGWDGTFNGAAQPFGVYVYEMQAVTNTGQLYTRQGNITLLR